MVKRQKIIVRLIIIFILFTSIFAASTIARPTFVQAQQIEKVNNYQVYLPLILNNYSQSYASNDKFIGIYMQVYWDNSTIQNMASADNLAGKKHSVSAYFMDIADQNMSYNLTTQLETLWQSGYISFININTTQSAYDIASGKYDASIRNMARVYAGWVNTGGGRRAFLAPLPEMNGVNSDNNPWASYGGDPANFKLAYQRIQTIFVQEGVTSDEVWWVFAPNGWSIDGHEFEKYYPGDGLVDVIAFSSYNYGYCHVAIPWQRWENYDTLYEPYLARLLTMAPNKPVIIGQTGTTAQYQSTNEYNVDAKNNWLKLNYQYLSQQPQLLGVLYYDFDQSSWECNWRILPGSTFTGYKDGASAATFKYISSSNMQNIIP